MSSDWKQVLDETLPKELLDCVAKHCQPIAKQPDVIRQHATRICFFQANHERIMRRFSGRKVLADLDRHLGQAELHLKKLANEHNHVMGNFVRSMPEMSIEARENDQNGVIPEVHTVNKIVTVERTNKRTEHVETERKRELVQMEFKPQHPDKFENRYEALASIRAGIRDFKRIYIAKAPALITSEKTEPAAVASACRQTWREIYGEKKVPKSPHRSRLGPMARFINDVFITLELRAPDDRSEKLEPNPVSALDFVDRLGGDSALELSLTWD